MSRRQVFEHAFRASAIAAIPVPAMVGIIPDVETEISRLGVKYDAAKETSRRAIAGHDDYPDGFHFLEDDVAEDLIATKSVGINDLKIKAKALFDQSGYREELWGHPERWTYSHSDEGLLLSLIEDILSLTV